VTWPTVIEAFYEPFINHGTVRVITLGSAIRIAVFINFAQENFGYSLSGAL
jgi:hypothetical protein